MDSVDSVHGHPGQSPGGLDCVHGQSLLSPCTDWILSMDSLDKVIHVIFSWTQIGRFGFTDWEIGSQLGRFFGGKKYSILVSKIVICSTVDHCKMFYLPAYC